MAKVTKEFELGSEMAGARTKPRYQLYSRLNQRIIDAFVLGIGFLLAYEIRFAASIPPASRLQMWLVLAPMVIVGLSVTSLFGIYRLVWRYIGLGDAVLVARSLTAFSAIMFLVCSVLPHSWALLRVPRSIILIQFLLSLVAALSARALRRVSYEWKFGKRSTAGKSAHVILVGAGHAGMAVAKELGANPNIRAVGFLDDDPELIGTQMCGLRVLGEVGALPCVVRTYAVTEVIVSVARDQQALLRRVWALCEELSVRVRVVPPLDEILNGKINISALKEVDENDLMGRQSATTTFSDPVRAHYGMKRILVTGAGGSIGSELANQLAGLEPRELILLDKDENGLHDACLRIRAKDSALTIHAVVADLRNADRVRNVFARFRPEVIFHAAAHKHVSLMEANPCEAILNNVVSTRNVVDASLELSVPRFLLVSTDKAVRPTSIMGASKRVCEMIVQAHNGSKKCHFCCVRFGNVLGSRGSVLPIFQKRVAQGEPLLLTHRDVRRYLMTIPEAVSLLIQAGTLSSGRTFVLDMGEPVLIRDLASRLIEYCGLRPGRDIPIEVTSLQQGEKLSEELYDDVTERLIPSALQRINAIESAAIDAASFSQKLAVLLRSARADAPLQVKQALREMNIGFGQEETESLQLTEEPVFASVGQGQTLMEHTRARPHHA